MTNNVTTSDRAQLEINTNPWYFFIPSTYHSLLFTIHTFYHAVLCSILQGGEGESDLIEHTCLKYFQDIFLIFCKINFVISCSNVQKQYFSSQLLCPNIYFQRNKRVKQKKTTTNIPILKQYPHSSWLFQSLYL